MSVPTFVEPSREAQAARLARGLLWVLVTSVAALAAAGVVLSATVLRTDDTPGPLKPPTKSTYAVAQDVPVSFGVVAVELVKKVKGLSARDVGGANHGISGFVRDGKAEVDLAITWRNTTKAPVAYNPRAFSLRVGSSRKPVAAISSSVRPGRLEPGATLDGVVRFVVPARRERMRAFFKDPGAVKPVVIDLGRVRSGASTRSRPAQPAPPRNADGHADGH